MAVLSVANLDMSVGNRVLLDGVNLTLGEGTRAALVGKNGCGKSCLLRALAGEEAPPHHGQIQWRRQAAIGYLPQHPILAASRTLRAEAAEAVSEISHLHEQLSNVAEAMASADGETLETLMRKYEQIEHQFETLNGYAVEHRIDATLAGLGLGTDLYEVPVPALSGGQLCRLALAKLLIAEPDAILLDEPTNHLDIEGRSWLESFLVDYGGTVLLVSHDRTLLDRVVHDIYELEAGRLVRYPGNYSAFRTLRHQRRLADQRAFDRQQGAIKRERAFIDRYRAGQRARQAKGREKKLNRMVRDEGLEPPVELDEIDIHLAPGRRSGDIVIRAEQIDKSYDQRTLFRSVDLELVRGDRLGLIGPNGIGKTTLVRCLLGEQAPDHGSIRLGAQVDCGYYRQGHEGLDLEQTVVEYLQRQRASTEQQARDTAGAFLFSDEEQDALLHSLSGGERSRAVLAATMTRGHNLLVLDEPTNHLDIPSVERLEEALLHFTTPRDRNTPEGTLVLISHDRMLLDRLVNQLIIFEGDGKVRHFLGNYSAYLASRSPALESQPEASVPPKPRRKTKPAAPTRQASRQPLARMNQERLEAKIEDLEQKIAAIDHELGDPTAYSNGETVRRLTAERTTLSQDLDPLAAEWTRRADAEQ